jgi:hypothetical protein
MVLERCKSINTCDSRQREEARAAGADYVGLDEYLQN